MTEEKLSIDETTLSVDLSDATQAVKESRFEDLKSFIHPLIVIIGVSYEFFSHRQWNLRSRVKEVPSKEN